MNFSGTGSSYKGSFLQGASTLSPLASMVKTHEDTLCAQSSSLTTPIKGPRERRIGEVRPLSQIIAVPEKEKRIEIVRALSTEHELDLDLKWCPFCSREVSCSVQYVSTQKTFWSAIAIFFTGGVLGCFMIPYMMNSCKKLKTLCATCGRELGLTN